MGDGGGGDGGCDAAGRDESHVAQNTKQEDRVKLELPAGVSVGSDEANICVWVATVFGPAETLWDGGMFQVELVFPPDFPDAPPFVHFLTPMFHPQINAQGVPYLRSLVMCAPAVWPPHQKLPFFAAQHTN